MKTEVANIEWKQYVMLKSYGDQIPVKLTIILLLSLTQFNKFIVIDQTITILLEKFYTQRMQNDGTNNNYF